MTKKERLPTAYKKINPCKSCGAHIINTYDYFNNAYKWQCTGCGAIRYESEAKFETKFIGADRLIK